MFHPTSCAGVATTRRGTRSVLSTRIVPGRRPTRGSGFGAAAVTFGAFSPTDDDVDGDVAHAAA